MADGNYRQPGAKFYNRIKILIAHDVFPPSSNLSRCPCISPESGFLRKVGSSTSQTGPPPILAARPRGSSSWLCLGALAVRGAALRLGKSRDAGPAAHTAGGGAMCGDLRRSCTRPAAACVVRIRSKGYRERSTHRPLQLPPPYLNGHQLIILNIQ
ncbi:hypothetical protein BS78_03G136100 [Paspalum vaginatum]|nr:hypothetical protein BS78_03G136100 [Paspalum vaginatum]